MPEEVMPQVYRLNVPLPNNPLKAVNSYVFKSPDRNLIVDTGMNREECLSAIREGLDEIGLDLGKTDFFITHMHADHSGLVAVLAEETSRIFCSREDSVLISPNATPGEYLISRLDFTKRNGFPESVVHEAIRLHPGFRYSARGRLEFSLVGEGDVINVGEYSFRCVETPGHTRGHLCLYEPRKKILISGDHILNDITPNISLWSDQWNPLQEYLSSLDKVGRLEVELVLPGHREPFSDCRGRIRELKYHHRTRAEEVLSILQTGALDAYRVASLMSWDLTYDSWEQFPAPQKWFATGEALSHLKYLTEEGLTKKVEQDEILLYCSSE